MNLQDPDWETKDKYSPEDCIEQRWFFDFVYFGTTTNSDSFALCSSQPRLIKSSLGNNCLSAQNEKIVHLPTRSMPKPPARTAWPTAFLLFIVSRAKYQKIIYV